MHKTWWFGPPETASQRTLRSFTVLHCLDQNRGRKRWRDRRIEHLKDHKNHVWHWMIYNDLLIFKTSTDPSTSHELKKNNDIQSDDAIDVKTKALVLDPQPQQQSIKADILASKKYIKQMHWSLGCRNVLVNWLSLTITIWIWKSSKSHSGS